MKIKAIAFLASLLVGAGAYAATPVAVWDGDFSDASLTQSGWTLDYQGNQRNSAGTAITIDRDNNGINIDTDTPSTDGITVILRYSGLATGSYDKVLAATCVESSHTYDRTGMRLLTSGTLCGCANGSTTSGTMSSWGSVASSAPQSGYMAFRYKGSGNLLGTFIYFRSSTGTYPASSNWGTYQLSYSADSEIYGVTIGGVRKAVSSWEAAKGMTIDAIAIFDSALTVDEMNAYSFSQAEPYEVHSNTTVSALNEALDGKMHVTLNVDPGVEITCDTAFEAAELIFNSTGTIKLIADIPPTSTELAKLDFTGVQGAVVRSWLKPGVVGYNFRNDSGGDTSGQLATDGTWCISANSANGTDTSMFADGLSTLSWSASGTWGSGVGSSITTGYLDDNSTRSPVITLSAVPYEEYDVVIYCSTDANGYQFSAKEVNGKLYTWDGSQTVETTDENAAWGQSKSATIIEGTNAIRVNGLSGALTIKGGKYSSGTPKSRSCIAAIQIMPAGTSSGKSEIVIDATEGMTISDSDMLSKIRTTYNNVRILGDGENGITLDYGTSTASFTSHILFEGGKHILKYRNGGTADIPFGENSSEPVIETANGAILDFYQHDLSGWQGSAEAKVPNSNIRVNAGTQINIYPYGPGTTYYQGRYTIEPGGTITSYFTDGSPSTFRLNGGAVQGCEQIYVPSSDPGSAPAVFNGCEGNTGLRLPADNTKGLGFYVGANSTLDFDLAITSYGSDQPIGKWGEGTLNFKGDLSGYASTLTIHEGTVLVSTATTLANVVNNATLAFAYGANQPAFTAYSGSGNVQIDVSELTPEAGNTYVLMAGIAMDASKVELINLSDSKFHVAITDEGVVLTDYTGFDPTWTGASGVWSASQFDGREGDTTDRSVIFAESAGNAMVAVTVSGEKSVASLAFIASDTEYTLTGNKITATGAINVSGASPVVIATPVEAGAISLGADTSLTILTNDMTIVNEGLSGTGTLIFDHGVGNEFTMSSGNTSFTGDVIIESGTVKMGNGTSFGPVNTPGTITVKNAAVLDMNGAISGEYNDLKCSVILENGATLTASKYTSAHGGRWSALTTLTLNGNANVDASMANVVMGRTLHYTYCNINLNGNKLTKTGNNDFIISHCSINGIGEFRIKEGSVSIYKNYWGGEAGRCTDGKIVIDPGATFIMNDGSNFSANMLELNGSVTRANENSTFTVTGTISGTGTTPMLTLADGATLKPKSLTEKLTVTESLTLSGNINVDISDLDLTGKFKLPLITTPTQITAEQVASFVRGANSENWKIYSEETSSGTYEFGVKIESIPWTGLSGVWTDTGFNGGDNNYINDGSQKVIFPDDDDSSATPLEVTVMGEKNVDTLGVTADQRAVTITGDAITAGTVTKSGKGIATIKSALTVGTELALMDGILVLNPTEEAIDTAGMDDGTLVVYVAAGTTNTISVAITAAKLIKLGPGTLALGNANNISGGTLLEDGQIVSTVVPANNVAIAAGATFTLKDVQWVSGNRFSGEGMLELYLSSSTRNFGGSEALDLPGKLKVTRLGSGWPVFKGGFSTRSELEITEGTNAGLVMDVGYIGEGNAFQVKNLSGGGTINPQNGATGGNRFIDTLQTAPTEFKGNFMAGGTSGGGAERSAALIVRGDEHSYGLTLSGASTTKGDLIITDNGKVIFSETGSWANGAVTVNDSGWLEVRNPAAMTSAMLTLNDGATVVIPLVEEAVVPLAAQTINASGNVYVDLTEIGLTPASEAITVMTGYAGEDVSGLKPRGCTGTFSVDEGTVTFTPGVSAPWTGGSATWSATGIENSSESTGYAELTAVTFGTIGAPETEATITIEGTRTPATIVFNGGEGTTYKLTGGALKPVGAMTIQSGTVEIDTEAVLNAATGAGALIIGEGGVVAIALAGSIAGDIALSGTGTLVLDGFLPDETLRAKLVDEAWQGTVWIKNIGESVLMEAFADYGNANSSVKFTNVHAYADGADCLWTLVLEDDAETGDYAWYDNGGASDGEVKVAKLIGTGTFYDDGASGSREKVTFTDVSGFAGSISTTGKRIGLGGTNELDASNAGSVEVVAEKTLAIAAGKGLAATRVLIAGTVEMTASSLVLGEVAGTGTIRCAALLNVAPTFGTDWTGSVELPVVAADGLNLNAYGRSGSKVVVGGITGGYLHAESGYQVAPDLELQGDMLITDASVRAYTFQTISGSGNFSFDTGVAITSISIAKIAAGYTGIVTNNTSATLTIGGIALDAAPTMGEKVLSAGGTGTIANTTSTVDGVDYTIFQDTTDRNLYMAVVSITKDSTTTYYKTAQAALNTLTGEATLAGMAPVPPFTWAALTDLAVPDAVTSIDMAGIRDFTNWSFDAGTTVAVRPTLAEVVAGEIEVTNVPDGVTAITVYRYGSDEVFDQIAISAGQGKLVIDTEVAGTYSTYLNNTATPNADSANASWQSFNLRNAVTEPDSVHFLFADAATDIAEIAEVVALTSITVKWGSTTHNNANFGGSGDVAITTKPYLVVTTSDNVIVAISAEGDSAWTASGSTTFNFAGEQLLFANARYRFQFADSVDGLAVGDEFTEAKIARCNCRWHASGRIAEEDTRCSGNNTYSINAQITVGIVRTVNYRKTISDDAQWSTEKPSGWEDGAAPYIAITAAEDSTPTFTFDTDVTAGVLTVDGAVTVEKDDGVTTTFGSIVAKNGAVLHDLGVNTVSVTEGTATIVDWADASLISPGTGTAFRFAGSETLTSLPFVTDSVNVQGGIILAQPFANELFQPVGSKALVGFEAGADVTVTRMVLGNQGGVVQNFRQTGGTVTINGDGSVSGNANQTAPLLIGHWNSTVVYDMLGGTIDMPNGAVRLAWGNVGSSSGSATWNIGGGESVATVNTKGIRAGSERADMPGTINLKPNGVLNLRDGGIQFLSQNATLNLMGGTIVAATDMEFANAKANGTVLAAGTETVIDTGTNTVTLAAALTGSGTLVKRGTGKLIVTGSLANLTGTIRVDEGVLNMSSRRDLSNIVAGSGSGRVQVNQTQSEYLNGVTEMTNVSDTIAKVVVIRFDGSSVEVTVEGNVARLDEGAHPEGKAALYDFTFNAEKYQDNIAEDATFPNFGSSSSQLSADTSWTTATSLDNEAPNNLYARTSPYITAGNYPSTFTAVVYGTMPAEENNTLIAFGYRTGGFLALVRGETVNDVNLVWCNSDANNKEVISPMRAKAATATKHLYVFTKSEEYISVYLDGQLQIRKKYNSKWTLGSNGGFQVGSVLGGEVSGVATRPEADDPAVIEMVRIFGEELSDAVMAKLVEDYPFIDITTESTRTIASAEGTNTWHSTEVGTWTNSPEDDGHLPATNADVILTVEGEVPQWMSVVLNGDTVDAPNAIGDLHITGSQALTIRKSIGGHPVSISGVLTNEVDLTIHYGALDMATIPLQMGATGRITFDLTELVDGKRDTEPVYLTGTCEYFGARVTYVNNSSNNLISLAGFSWDGISKRYRATFTASRGNKEVYFEPVEGGSDNLFNKDSAVYYLQDETHVPTYIIAGDTLCFLVDEAATVTIATNDEMVAVAGYKIPAGVTVVFNEDLTVPVEGAGTIVMNKCKPQVTIDAVKNSLQDSEKWTGTLAIERVEFGNTSLSKLGNANSTIRLAGCSIYPQVGYEVASTLEIDNSTYGYGLHLRGVSDVDGKEVVFDRLTGSGLLMNVGDAEATTHNYLRILDASGFSGPVTNDAVGVTMLFGTGAAAEGSVEITADTSFSDALNLRSSMYAATNLIVRSNLIVGEKDVRITADSVDFGTGGTIALTGEDQYPIFIVQNQITGTIYVSLENFANLLAADDITVLRVNKAEYLPPIANVQRAPGAAQDYTLVIDADGKGYSLVNEGFYIRIR